MAAIELASTTLFNDANLVSYWKLENVNDSKGSNNLTNNNTVAFNAAKFNNGADGGTANTNKSLSIGTHLGYTGGAWSIVFWMKLQTEITSSIWYPFQLGDGATSNTRFDFQYQYNGGTIQYVTGRTRSNVANDYITRSGALGTTNTNHFAISYDTANVIHYFNGTAIGTVASSGNGGTPETTGFNILSSTINTLNTSAIIDDFAVFSKTLTQTDIDLLYNGPVTGTLLSADII